MSGRRNRDASIARIVSPALACSLLAACASSPAGPPSGAGVRGLFRAGPSTYPTAASPHSPGWYSPAKAPQFSKSGRAVWQGEPRRRGVSAWIARVFRKKPAAGPPLAVIAADAALPVPSLASVTNLETYATTTVRVEQRAALGGALVALSPETAQGLGVSPGRPLTVRVRYAGPVIAYRERPDMRQALRRPARHDPQLAAAPAAVPAPATAAPATEAVVVVQAVLRPALQPPSAVRLRTSPPSDLRVQAGAFAQRGNAERAVALLRPAGHALIEVVHRGETTLYRVSLGAPRDAAQAEALRRRVVKIGFADARVVRS